MADGQRLSCPVKLSRGWGSSGTGQKAVTKIHPIYVVLFMKNIIFFSSEKLVKNTMVNPYRFPRVFGDEFGDEFGDSLNFVSKLVTYLVMISVNHRIW